VELKLACGGGTAAAGACEAPPFQFTEHSDAISDVKPAAGAEKFHSRIIQHKNIRIPSSFSAPGGELFAIRLRY